MRECVIAGNWKMNTTPWEGVTLIQALGPALASIELAAKVTVVVCPPPTHLSYLHAIILGMKTEHGVKIELGAQNVHWEHKGAFTGEVSAQMLKSLGCKWAIIGHSERRQWFGETDRTVNLRLLRVIKNGLRPIVCVGETLEEREGGRTFDVLERQLDIGLEGATRMGRNGLVIAYEPVWAIGTGRTASSEQAQEAHNFIRSKMAEHHGQTAAESTVIQYGGSVNETNAAELLACTDVDGALVGGASLDAAKFAEIIHAGDKLMRS